MVKKLILHIGTMKTGSTSLQTMLDASAKGLARQNAFYVKCGRSPAFPQKHQGLIDAARRSEQKARTVTKAMISEILQAPQDTAIVSAEAIAHGGPAMLKTVRDLTAAFETTVLCILRRHDLMIEAHWAQMIKAHHRKHPETIESYTNRALNAPTANFLNYHNLLTSFMQIGLVKAVPYEDVQNIGLCGVFKAQTGLSLSAEEIVQNESPGLNAIAHLALMKPPPRRAVRRQMLTAFRGDTAKTALGAQLRRRVHAHYAEDRARLTADFGIVFSEDMPAEPLGPRNAPDPVLAAAASRRLAKAALKAEEKLLTQNKPAGLLRSLVRKIRAKRRPKPDG